MKVELKVNSVNQIIKGTDVYVEGDKVTTTGLVVKGRVCIHAQGMKVLVGSGAFLGLTDLSAGVYSVTYTAETDVVIYAFPAMTLSQQVRGLVQLNRDYGPVVVTAMNKYIRDLSKIFEELENQVDACYAFLKEGDSRYRELAQNAGVRPVEMPDVDKLEELEHGSVVDLNKAVYYRACCDIPNDVQKSYYGYNTTITLYHVMDQVSLLRLMIRQCSADASYLVRVMEMMVKERKSLFGNIADLALTKRRMGEDVSEIIALFDKLVEQSNMVENLLIEKADIDMEIDHDHMEEVYFKIISGNNGKDTANSIDGDMFALVEHADVSAEELYGSLNQILDFAEMEPEKEDQFRQYIEQFEALPDKMSTDDDVRQLRHSITKMYYELYKKVFRKDHDSQEDTPLVIDLFLRYGFLSEKLLTEQMLEELLSIDTSSSEMGSCKVYDMKEWLTEILEGRKEPSKSEFDLDYDATLREKRKTGEITEKQQHKMERDVNAKFDFEVQNLFRTNHRLIFGQVSSFVPFMFAEGCTGSLQRNYMAKDKINAAINKLLRIDFSAFYRESLYMSNDERIKREYIMEEVFPDIILFPTVGSKGVMWQEISGRRRNTPARFLLPSFLETDLDTMMIRLLGRFRWELCRTMQGSSWNNIQIKSLTSEYSDFIQFYRKNRDLSDEKKEKLKLQIQKARNSTREVFVVDYENWIRHESQGGLILNKPTREILATYCPFRKELREKINEQPMFRDAMARFVRERGKKRKEYDLKFRVWEKDKVKVPKEIISTRDFYVEM